MAKFYGVVGFAKTVESVPGVWKEQLYERTYKGEVLSNKRKWENGEHLNDNFLLNNQFSIIADSFCFANLPHIRYVKWMGAVWKVTNIEVQRPRLILTIGGVYNGSTLEAAQYIGGDTGSE